jgi:hypothetical protein
LSSISKADPEQIADAIFRMIPKKAEPIATALLALVEAEQATPDEHSHISQ